MTTHRWLGISVVLAGGLISIGCSSGYEPDTTPKYNYPDKSSFCQARAEAECTATVLDECQTAKETCIDRRRALCGSAHNSEAKYRPAEADGCIAAIKPVFQDRDYTPEERAKVAEACELLFGGSGVEGTSCTEDSQCDLDQDLRCVTRVADAEPDAGADVGAVAGQCYVPEEKEPGGSCDAPNVVCSEGNFCTDSDPHVCANKRDAGMSCSPTLPCRDDLRCVGDGTAAKCQPKYDVGTICVSDEECKSGMCSKVGANMQCVSKLSLGANEPLCDEFR